MNNCALQPNKYDLVVIGDGIAAKCLLFEIAKNQTLNKLKIAQVYCEQYVPCSLKTTSVVSGGVHTKGISELGDLLVDSFDAFLDFYKQGAMGIYPARQFYILPKETFKKEQFLKRYGDNIQSFNGVDGSFQDSFIIKPETMYSYMEEAYSILDVTKIDMKVEDVNIKDRTVSSKKSELHFDKLVLCSSVYTNFFFEHINLPKGKPVSGSYYLWKDCDLFNEDIVLSKGHFNIIYRQKYRELLFGGTSFEGHVLDNNSIDLKDYYLEFRSIFKDLNLPDICEALEITGIRHKGKKRMPFMGEIEDNIYAMTGLYKNGFTFPFNGAKKITNLLYKDPL